MLQDIIDGILGVLIGALGFLTIWLKTKVNEWKEASKKSSEHICNKIELIKQQNELIKKLLGDKHD